MTRQEVISRLRNSIKEVNADTKYTNRYLWNVFWTNAQLLIKQESDRFKLYNQTDIFKTICVKMEAVSPLLCDCLALPMDCVVYRSRFKLPKLVEGSYGMIYRFISSADLSNKIVLTTPYTYSLKQTKYNKEKYGFIHDSFLWLPNTKWSHIIISGIFETDIPKEFQCDCEESTQNDCGSLLFSTSGVPQYLIQPAIQMALQELGATKTLISDELGNTNPNEKQIST